MALTQISTQGIKDGTITGSDLATNVDLVDNQKLRLGNSQDLQIFHDGSNSKITNATGNFIIEASASGAIALKPHTNEIGIITRANGASELYFDNSKKFETKSTGVIITGNDASGSENLGSFFFKTASGTVRGHFDTSNDRFGLKDNVLAAYGNSNDLQIYHDGTDSFIDNSTGNLKIIAPNNVEAIKVFTDGTVNIGGNADNVRLRFGIGSDLQIYHTGSHSIIRDSGTGNLQIAGSFIQFTNADITSTGLTFAEGGGVGLYHNNSKKFDTTTYGVKVTGRLAATTSITGADNVQIKLGDSDDLKIYSDGTNGILQGGGSGANAPLFLNFNTIRLQTQSGGEKYIDCQENGAVELYHNGTKMCNTDSTGVSINGRIHTQLGTNHNSFNKTTTGKLVSLMTDGTERGNISSNGSTVQFNTTASDKSLKKNFEDWTENTLNLFKNINAQKFNFLDQEDGTDKEKGFIAQDMVVSFPEAYQKNDDDKYMFNPSGMVVYLMKAIQELEAEVAALKAG